VPKACAGGGGLRDALVLPLDVTDAGAFTPAMMQFLDAWGGVDLVILNAGTYCPCGPGS
jgi:NADP-dependent 3-hydroxy acid dehydrogenase YdfG